ncbi:MAG: TIGR03960 family B12-binding radical SAM protein [Actinomycetota bacterium]|nr:TIGR03960 family B12-binding radical SAM protein [Actinomycetota bacterium]
MKSDSLEKILPLVQRPARYIDGEWNAVHKPHHEVDLKIALIYPDTYEVGLPNLGLQILYEILNDENDVVAERAYAPWIDMEEVLRKKRIPLFALESRTPLISLDILGFSLQYEMTYTNILNVLDLAGIPPYATDRDERYPLVIAGGPCAFNPEPLAPFFDLFVIGDGEEVVLELVEEYKKGRGSRVEGRKGQLAERRELLKRLAGIEGIYVPRFYDVEYYPSGQVKKIQPNCRGIPKRVSKRTVKDLNDVKFPMLPLVPYVDVVHDRCSLEVMRGCTRGCRFCQAGIIYRPVRERSHKLILRAANDLLQETGYEEISLVSLSSSDYSLIQPLLRKLMDNHSQKGISISLPSLRLDTFSVELASQIQRVKKTGLTFAPEAGTQRLRDAINKCLTEEDLLATVKDVFESGWRKLKLYFMIGLPTETQGDLQGIVDLAHKIVDIGLSVVPKREWNRIKVALSVASFVPKSHTPFQWVAQNPLPELEKKIEFLRKNLQSRYILLKWQDPKLSVLEAALARGDRRLSKVIERAFKIGCRFDAWTEQFNFDKWLKAFEESGVSLNFYAHRERSRDEVFPWDHINSVVNKEYLWNEYQRALSQTPTEDCRTGPCSECGVCQTFKLKPVLEREKLCTLHREEIKK